MAEERKERCETCRFFQQMEEDYGICRRFPPVEVAGGKYEDTGFPFVFLRIDWCGEWKAKTKEPRR